MGLDSASHEEESVSSKNSHAGISSALKKKRSITRLFASSRKATRSRPPSIEELHTPPTPTIPEHFKSLSGKNSDSPTPPLTSNGSVCSIPDAYKASTETLDAPFQRDATRADSLRGILKPRKRTDSDEVTSQPGAQSLPRSGALSRKASLHSSDTREKPLIHHAPTFPDLQKKSSSHLSKPGSGRLRALSTSPDRTPHLQVSSDNGPSMPRPSTAGAGTTEKEPKDERRQTDRASPTADNSAMLSEEVKEEDVVRASFRSAVTATSSIVDASSTTRNSVLTKDTSISETTVGSPRRPDTEGGMTVDEAIGMYAAGFSDDVDPVLEPLSRSSISEEERRRSIKIAEAINDTIGYDLEPPVRPSIADSRSSTAIVTGAVFKSQSPKAPPVMPPTAVRDQYGFLKANRHVSIHQYEAWDKTHSPEQERRTKKWLTYMREQGCPTYLPTQFPDRSPKTQRFIRKGIPPAWRGSAWFHYAGGTALLEKNPNVYSSLLLRAHASELDLDDQESIERDLHRTFPDNIHFKPDLPTYEGPLLNPLRRVLQAFAVYCPEVGYCQSLNFLAGLLLLFLPEEKAFWMLHIIATDHLPGTHEISLEGANIDLWVLMMALRDSIPTVWAKVGIASSEIEGSLRTAKLPPISLCTTSWFMSMFIGTLPIESVLRVWDVLFYEGSKTLFRVALAIFRLGEPRIREISDPVELFQVVQALPKGMLDVGTLIGVMCRRGGVSQDWVNKKRKERRKWYAQERTKVANASQTENGNSGATPSSPSSADSVWRRRAGWEKR